PISAAPASGLRNPVAGTQQPLIARSLDHCKKTNPTKNQVGFVSNLEREVCSRSFFCVRELVVLRVHSGPAADFVPDKPQLRRDAVDIPDLTRVARITCRKAALRPQDGSEGSIEVAVEKCVASASTNCVRSSKRCC